MNKKQLIFARNDLRKRFWGNPVISEFKKSLEVPAPVGAGGRLVKAIECRICHKFFKSKNIEMDHIEECGSFTDFETLRIWYVNLFCDPVDGIQPLCKKCHGAKTYACTHDISLSQAKIIKRVIEIEKEKSTIFMQKVLAKHNYMCNNKTTRRNNMIEMMKQIKKEIANAKVALAEGEVYKAFDDTEIYPGDFDMRSPFFEEEITAAIEAVYFEIN